MNFNIKKENKKILLTNHHLYDYAGSELVTLDLALEFKNKGWDVYVATFRYGGNMQKLFEQNNITVVNVLNDSLLVKEFDLVWGHHFPVLIKCLIEECIRTKSLVLSSLSPYEPLEAIPFFHSQSDLILCNSEETKKDIMAHNINLDKQKLFVFNNSVPSNWFNLSLDRDDSELKKIAVISNHPTAEILVAIDILKTKKIDVDLIGISGSTKLVTIDLLILYDAVITIGRTVQHCMTLGIPVFCYDHFGGPGWLTPDNFQMAEWFNYSGRCCNSRLTSEQIVENLINGFVDSKLHINFFINYAAEKYSVTKNINAVLGIISNSIGEEEKDYIVFNSEQVVGKVGKVYRRIFSEREILKQDLERSQSQLSQTQIELERSQSQLSQTQIELERSQYYLNEAFINISQEREQFQLKLQLLESEINNEKNLGIKSLIKKLKAKIKKKFTNTFLKFKHGGINYLLNYFTNEILAKSKTLLPDKELIVFSSIDKIKFWQIVNPIIEEKKSKFNLEKHPIKISILTPTWNSSLDWFIDTVLSVLKQSSSEWEWCIVDDGSQDPELREILTELSNKCPRIKLDLQETGGGISYATNKALELATADYICFLDHDDTLEPTAIETLIDNLSEGLDVVYSDENKIDFSGKTYVEPFFKPDWSPEYLRGVMYIGHLLCLRKDLATAVGGFNKEYDGVQDYEFMLRISEKTQKIGHIPKILYHWRKIPGSIAADINAKPNIEALQIKAVDAHLQRIGLLAKAEGGKGNHRVKIVPHLKKDCPLISIIIPTKDAPTYLEKCLKSIFTLSKYPNYEVILVDNKTTDTKALQVMTEFPVKRIDFPDPFNYSRANNLGSNLAQGEYLVFLNNDTEVLTKDWLEYLLYYAEQPDIGAVGSLLLFPDNTVQHAGIVMGFRGTADHVMRGFPINVDGYAGSLVCSREVSAVTAACMMINKSIFEEIGKFNEHFFTHYQDVDLCMRLVQNNKKIICTPHSVLIHYESKTRKSYYDMVDRMLLLDQWQDYIDKGDPFYNPNFDMGYDNYTIKT